MSESNIIPQINMDELIKRIAIIDYDVINHAYVFRDKNGNAIELDNKTYLNLCDWYERR